MTTSTFAIGIVAFATLISALGPIFMKKGAATFSLNPRKLIKNYNALLGCAFFGISAVFFVIGLKYGELSVLYPITALSYIWACALSVKYLGEKMNKYKWVGIGCIIIGVALIGMGRAMH